MQWWKMSERYLAVDTRPLIKALAEYYRSKTRSRALISFFDQDECILFLEYLSNFSILISPESLAEIWSIIKGKLSKKEHKNLFEKTISFFENLIEKYVPKEDITSTDKFPDFGFTDLALSKIVSKNVPLLTSDWKLWRYCKKKNIPIKHTDYLLTRLSL